MKPGSGSIKQSKSKVSRSTGTHKETYCTITRYSELTPGLLLDLTCYVCRRTKSERENFYIRHYHNEISCRLASIIGTSKSKLLGAFISLGIIGLCKHYNILQSQTSYIIKSSSSSFRQSATRKIEDRIKKHRYLFDKHEEAKKKLKFILLKYNNEYSDIFLNTMFGKQEVNSLSSAASLSHTKRIHENIISMCSNITEQTLNSRMFELSNKRDNKHITVTLPGSIVIVVRDFMFYVSNFKKSKSDCYRAAFVTGLYVFCEWVVERKLGGLSEYAVGEMLHEIDKLLVCDYEEIEKGNIT